MPSSASDSNASGSYSSDSYASDASASQDAPDGDASDRDAPIQNTTIRFEGQALAEVLGIRPQTLSGAVRQGHRAAGYVITDWAIWHPRADQVIGYDVPWAVAEALLPPEVQAALSSRASSSASRGASRGAAPRSPASHAAPPRVTLELLRENSTSTDPAGTGPTGTGPTGDNPASDGSVSDSSVSDTSGQSTAHSIRSESVRSEINEQSGREQPETDGRPARRLRSGPEWIREVTALLDTLPPDISVDALHRVSARLLMLTSRVAARQGYTAREIHQLMQKHVRDQEHVQQEHVQEDPSHSQVPPHQQREQREQSTSPQSTSPHEPASEPASEAAPQAAPFPSSPTGRSSANRSSANRPSANRSSAGRPSARGAGPKLSLDVCFPGTEIPIPRSRYLGLPGEQFEIQWFEGQLFFEGEEFNGERFVNPGIELFLAASRDSSSRDSSSDDTSPDSASPDSASSMSHFAVYPARLPPGLGR